MRRALEHLQETCREASREIDGMECEADVCLVAELAIPAFEDVEQAAERILAAGDVCPRCGGRGECPCP